MNRFDNYAIKPEAVERYSREIREMQRETLAAASLLYPAINRREADVLGGTRAAYQHLRDVDWPKRMASPDWDDRDFYWVLITLVRNGLKDSDARSPGAVLNLLLPEVAGDVLSAADWWSEAYGTCTFCPDLALHCIELPTNGGLSKAKWIPCCTLCDGIVRDVRDQLGGNPTCGCLLAGFALYSVLFAFVAVVRHWLANLGLPVSDPLATSAFLLFLALALLGLKTANNRKLEKLLNKIPRDEPLKLLSSHRMYPHWKARLAFLGVSVDPSVDRSIKRFNAAIERRRRSAMAR